MHHGLVGVPGIKGGIGSDVGGKEAQCRHGADVERNKVGDIVLVKGLGVLGQDHIAIAGHDGRGHTAAIAPEQFLALLFGAIGLLLIDAFFDAQPTIGIAFGLLIFLEAFADIGAPVVFFDPGVDMGHVEGHDLAQTRDLFAQGLHGFEEEGLQHRLLEAALFLAQPASRGHGALDIEAVGLADIEDGTKAQFEHQQGMLHEEAAQARAGGQVFLHLEQESLDVSTLWVSSLARLRGVKRWFGDDSPLKERKEGTVALHDRVMLKHEG